MNTADEQAVWEYYWQRSKQNGFIHHTPQLVETIVANVDLTDCRTLEIGAGTGGDSITIAGRGAKSTALDFSSTALGQIASNASRKRVSLQLVQGDIRTLPFRDSAFDLIFHQGLLEHFMKPDRLLREQYRVLDKKGFLLIDVPQRYTLYTAYKRYRMWRGTWHAGGWETEFSFRQLLRLLEDCDFRPVDSYGRILFPYLISGRNQLERIERLFFSQQGLPPRIWRWYDAFWHKLERSSLGHNILMSIGVLAQKV